MPALRTRVYIDGYNLYYGCLRKTAFKWLDVLTLFETQILPSTAQGVTGEPPPPTEFAASRDARAVWQMMPPKERLHW